MRTHHIHMLVTIVALTAFGTARAAAQPSQPSPATLQGAVLTAGEVGAGCSTVTSGPSTDNLAYTITGSEINAAASGGVIVGQQGSALGS